MASHPDGTALRSIHALFTAGTAAGLADAQLIERFVLRDGDAAELAFAALVERHGPMVLRVCRSVLRDPHDSEDAFQAVFLILARKAGSLLAREALGPWLHGVALNVATTARATDSRRREHERKAASRPRDEDSGGWDDLVPAIHEELGRLPDRYRAAVVLCLFEGLTREQAASQLGWPLGTVQSRLARGRERLRERLTRRGFAPGAALSVALAPYKARVPAALAGSTTRAATRFAAGEMATGVVSASVLTLMEGVLGTMRLTKLMTLGVSGLLLAAAVTGAGVLAQSEGEPAPAATPPKAESPAMKYELRVWKGEEQVGRAIEVHHGAPRGRLMRLSTKEGVFVLQPEEGDPAVSIRFVQRDRPVRADIMGDVRVAEAAPSAGAPHVDSAPSPRGVSVESFKAGISSLDLRITTVEQKLDRILRALEGPKATGDQHSSPFRTHGGISP